MSKLPEEEERREEKGREGKGEKKEEEMPSELWNT